MKYPIYIPSMGRWKRNKTAAFLDEEGTPFHLVVEPHEEQIYIEHWGEDRVLCLPESGQGLSYSRTWCKAHSRDAGDKRHWQMDDDLHRLIERRGKRRVRTPADTLLSPLEEWTDRYTNIAVAGLKHEQFGFQVKKPFKLNVSLGQCVLILNETPHVWGNLQDDTDYALRVLADGWCTVQFQPYQFVTDVTGRTEGGMTREWDTDGRLHRVRELVRDWPRLVTMYRGASLGEVTYRVDWSKFDTPLIRRDDIDWEALKEQTHGKETKVDIQ